uniref:AAA+ ATPase domain-containing protein n=1 Tax=Globodera rostochiensis TaxID=31243 RepID=A0A914HRL3_GLORO
MADASNCSNGCASKLELTEQFAQKLIITFAENEQKRNLIIAEHAHEMLDVEIRLTKANCLLDAENCIESLPECIVRKSEGIRNCRPFFPKESESFPQMVDRLSISCSNVAEGLPLNCHLSLLKSARYHFYVVKKFGAMAEEISLDASNGDEGGTVGSHQWEMPSLEFENLWETLVFDEPIKNELLVYINSLLEISCAGADQSILPLNRLILLHGPPGTGKTTLCKALAQKLAIRTQKQYKRAVLVEVNSHSLFSKWFSESGKLVQKLFTRIEELAEQPNWLVFVLIDEVESLTMGRKAAFSGADPSDSVRVVNAVLTQLDKVKRFPNVFILCTSNLEQALDPAFVDRADLVRKIGNPAEAAIRLILETAIEELQRINLVGSSAIAADNSESEKLSQLASFCANSACSGRSLRKLPVLAYAAARSVSLKPPPIEFDSFLDAFEKIVKNSSSFQWIS